MKPHPQPDTEQILAFKEWLRANRILVLPECAFELVRFWTPRGTSLICVNKRGVVTAMTRDASLAWKRFCNGYPWNGFPKSTKRRGFKNRPLMLVWLTNRDGLICTYCGKELTEETATFEHVIPRAQRGSDGMSNIVLACHDCNNEAGNMNIRQKIELAVVKRLQQGEVQALQVVEGRHTVNTETRFAVIFTHAKTTRGTQ